MSSTFCGKPACRQALIHHTEIFNSSYRNIFIWQYANLFLWANWLITRQNTWGTTRAVFFPNTWTENLLQIIAFFKSVCKRCPLLLFPFENEGILENCQHIIGYSVMLLRPICQGYFLTYKVEQQSPEQTLNRFCRELSTEGREYFWKGIKYSLTIWPY